MTELLMVIICICAAAAAAIAAILMRRKMLRISASVEKTLDDMLSGSFEDSDALYEDTLSAKINTKLKRLHEVLEGQIARNSKQHKQIQELISDISHQVKTPIASIKMLNETLSKPGLPVEKQEELRRLLDRQVKKLDFLTQAMLKSSRLETGMIRLAPRPLLIMDTLAQAMGGIAVAAERKNIEITVECGDHIRAVHDGKWTAEALFNIMDNAVKYTPDGGQIGIACEQWEVYTKTDIRDTGPGIPEDEQAQVFRRFYRSPSAGHLEGVGIGLYLSQEIIRQQGGYIKLSSAPGGGSCFSVFLPNS